MRVLIRRDYLLKSVFILFVLSFMFSFLSVSVTASDVEFRIRPIKNIIVPGETASVEIDVINNGDVRKDYTISTADFRWQLISDPLPDYFSGFSVLPGETKVLRLQFTPRGDLFFGIYSVRLDLVLRSTGERNFIDVPIEIRSSYPGAIDYAPAIAVEGIVNNNNRINPRETSTLVVNIDNRNPLNISLMELIVESPFIEERISTNLGPLEKKRFEFNFDVSNLEEPGIRDFTIRLVYDGKNIGSTPKSFPVQIIAYSEIVRDVDESSGFLSRQKIITLRNEGNIDNSDVVEVPSSFFSRLFTYTSPSPRMKEGSRLMVWDLELNPGSSAEVVVSVNYRPLLYAFIIIFAVVLLYYMLRSPLVVKKTAPGINSYEGGISEIKVLMHIKNRTPKTFNAFSVTEYVPKIAKYLKSESLGSIQPTKVLNHERKGTLLKWNFEAIEPFEERIIIYKMKLNFTVIGKLNLPPTTVKFKDDAGGSYTTKSNRLRINNLIKKEDSEKGGSSNG